MLTNLNLAANQLCGLDVFGQGTYDASGITALAEALKGNAVLTSIDVGRNNLNEEAALSIVRAVTNNNSVAPEKRTKRCSRMTRKAQRGMPRWCGY